MTACVWWPCSVSERQLRRVACPPSQSIVSCVFPRLSCCSALVQCPRHVVPPKCSLLLLVPWWAAIGSAPHQLITHHTWLPVCSVQCAVWGTFLANWGETSRERLFQSSKDSVQCGTSCLTWHTVAECTQSLPREVCDDACGGLWRGCQRHTACVS